jgi:hypothetical protein
VVGLLNETDTFYDMVTTRIAYVNMSLNPQRISASLLENKGKYAMFSGLSK